MSSRVLLFALCASLIAVAVIVVLYQTTEANVEPIHHRLETKTAIAGWGTCPEEEAAPGVVCTTTFIQVAESSTRQADHFSTGSTLSFVQNSYTYDAAGNLVPVSNSHGFTNELDFEQDSELHQAAMTAGVPVQTCMPDTNGNQVCRPAGDVEIAIFWSGDGRLIRDTHREQRQMGDWIQIIDSRNLRRNAAATGQAGDQDLGNSLYATLLRAETDTTWTCTGRCP
jgi:hypothetical protein